MTELRGSELLFVDACPRGPRSRTLALAKAFLARLSQHLPDLRIRRHTLTEMNLQPSEAAWLIRKDTLCDRRDWTDERFEAALAFRRADAVVIAAPYWDLSFPAILKTWVENIWVRNLTFVYQEDQAIGLACGKAAVYITTSGSFLAGHDWGTAYIRDVMTTLGIPVFESLAAEGLDLLSSDPERILAGAMDEVGKAADRMAGLLQH